MMDLPPGCRLTIEQNASWQDREFIDKALGDYNAAFLHDSRYDYFGLIVRDEASAIRAGLIGNLYAGWLFINLLWVHADLRRRGIGSALIAEAERRAIAFGCHSASVDTFSFQGPEFYPRFGYEVFGILDYPPAHKRFFLQKPLNAPEVWMPICRKGWAISFTVDSHTLCPISAAVPGIE
jgi:GNAT superfamily N-acetyltransferase